MPRFLLSLCHVRSLANEGKKTTIATAHFPVMCGRRDPHGRMDCLLRICTAMILLARDQLMQVCVCARTCL